MSKKVIHWKNLPTRRVPVLETGVAYLLLDRFNATGWIWGVIGVFILLLWIGYVHGFVTETLVDIFEEKNRKDFS